MKHRLHLLAGAIALATLTVTLAGCATTGTAVASANLDVAKGLRGAQIAYHAARPVGDVLVADPRTSPATVAAIGTLNDRAATALHDAQRFRTWAAVLIAAAAIADFSNKVGVPTTPAAITGSN